MSKDVRNSDVNIDEEVRRRSGDFYTPKIWVDEAHKMLDRQLGEGWREEYVVWDCACGVGNLTRDYEFKELYLSTLYEDDVQTIKDHGFNPGAEVFQFDFLNDPLQGDGIFDDSVESSPNIPEGLLKALRSGKKFVFLINPPFSAPGRADFGTGKSKGREATSVGLKMDVGRAKGQSYAQFMWRISEIVERFSLEGSVLAAYSKSTYVCGPSFGKFREYLYSRWTPKSGFVFPSSEFSSTSDSWPCLFHIWDSGGDGTVSDLVVDVNTADSMRGEVSKRKTLYAPDVTAQDWTREPKKRWLGLDTGAPTVTSAVKVGSDKWRGKTAPGSLGCLHSNANSVFNGAHLTGLYSTGFSSGQSIHVFRENFLRVVALFTARVLAESNWLTGTDEFCKPNTDHPGYEQWNHDAIVFSLFQTSSQQSSMRDVEYKGKLWDIQNEFFWMSNEEIKSLADEHDFKSLSKDCEAFNQDRHVYKVLQEVKLSPDAQEILDMASELVRNSMPLREECHSENPKFHLQAWDAGWYQVRNGILKEHFPDEYKEFIQKFLTFRDRMSEGVYEFGFLRR